MSKKISVNHTSMSVPKSPGKNIISYDDLTRKVGGAEKSDKLPTKNVVPGSKGK